MPRLLAIGDNTVDVYVDAGMQYPGGNAVNVAVQARRMGADAAYVGCIGNDARGRLVLDSLEAEAVDVSRVRIVPGANAHSRIGHRDGDRQFLGSDPGVRGAWEFGPDGFGFAQSYDLVHTSVHSDIDAHLPVLRPYARVLSYDYSVHWRRPGKAETLPLVDLAFFSCPDASEEDVAAHLAWAVEAGAGLAVATRAERGAMALESRTIHVQPAVACDPVDTLGAGDAFIAAFLLAWLAGGPAPDCLLAGVAAGAAACAMPGGFGHGQAL